MRLLQSFTDFVRSWWNVDRVRASPSEGQLLRLGPGALVGLDPGVVEVVGRRVDSQRSSVTILYDCRTASGSGRLRIDVGNDVGSSPRIEWADGAIVRRLSESDVIVWKDGAG